MPIKLKYSVVEEIKTKLIVLLKKKEDSNDCCKKKKLVFNIAHFFYLE